MITTLSATLAERLDEAGLTWLEESRERVRLDPGAIDILFPAAARRCGRGPLGDDQEPFRDWTVDEAVRALLVTALPLSGDELVAAVSELYGHGDSAERCAILCALSLLEGIGDAALPLVRDALRTNDTRLIRRALGAYGGRRLDDDAYRQAVLKWVFCEIPLRDAACLAERADARLADMLADYVRERTAAGRDVPPDVRPLIERHGSPTTGGTDAHLRSARPHDVTDDGRL